jgi:hypothetical protein
MSAFYRIVRKDWPYGLDVQIKTRWWPFWRTLKNCGLSEEWARSVIENHRTHGTVYAVLHCEPSPTPEAK